MANRQVNRKEMLERVAIFRNLASSKRPLVDAVLPQYARGHRQVVGLMDVFDRAARRP